MKRLIISKVSAKFLGITIDNKYTYREHIDSFCKPASYKLFTLQRIRKCLTTNKTEVLENAFITTQVNRSPLSWMCSGKRGLHKVYDINNTNLNSCI